MVARLARGVAERPRRSSMIDIILLVVMAAVAIRMAARGLSHRAGAA
jgi:hypothetical protein